MFAISSAFALSITLLFKACYGADLFEGDKCSLNDGSKGTCKFVTDCPTILKLVRNKITPKICGFEGNQSIICCADEGEVKVSIRSPGDKCKKKCKEYAQFAYDQSETPAITIVSQFSNILECAFDKEELIVGGTMAAIQEFPHMALIGYHLDGEVKWGCGGSLISENFVLTAAHCLSHIQLGPAVLVRVGLTNRTDLRHMQERTIAEAIAHPEYVRTRYHDIALLRLSRNVDLDIYARPACLHTEKDIPTDKAIATGWGLTEANGPDSNDLLKIVLEFFGLAKCNATHVSSIEARNLLLNRGIVEDYMLCAGSSKDIKDTCQGDSGGPLQIYHDESDGTKCMYDIVGVTSFGKLCGLTNNIPGVYTRVSYYIKWIEEVVWPDLEP